MNIVISPIFYVAVGIATTSMAQIVLKVGSSTEVLSKKWLLYLAISLLSYSVAFLCYYLALRYFDISKISPIMTVSTVAIVVCFGFLSGEQFSITRIIGIIISFVSIFLLLKD
jgi:drug/metabolite transporter (DMT)-like permease